MTKKYAGFTLIEVLVATSLTSIFMASTFYIIFSCNKTYNRITSSIQKLENGWMIMDRIRSDTRASAGIDNSSTSTKLVLLSGVSYDCVGRKIRRTEGGYGSYLSMEIIEHLIFSYPDSKTATTTICLGKNLVITAEGQALN